MCYKSNLLTSFSATLPAAAALRVDEACTATKSFGETLQSLGVKKMRFEQSLLKHSVKGTIRTEIKIHFLTYLEKWRQNQEL